MADHLWLYYSGGTQGFGIQASLWELTQGNEVERENQFSELVNWGLPKPEKFYLPGVRKNQQPSPMPGQYPRAIYNLFHTEGMRFGETHSVNLNHKVLIQKTLESQLERVMALATFEVVTVNARGEEIKAWWHQARTFAEDLGKGTSLEMVAIPGGTFLMGSLPDEEGRYENEGPQHEVTVPPFFMGKYPVTQAQWRQVVALPRVNRRLKSNPSKFKGEDQNPVELVSWEDAIEFCDRLSAYTHHTYRLPTEAEWEYACRAGTTTPFHFGDTITTDLANYRGLDWEYEGKTYPGNYGEGPYGIFREKVTAVGQFPPNAFGLYDMHGNVWEWCQDVRHDNYSGAPTDGSAWLEGGNQERRLCRGGAWGLDPRDCRSAVRSFITPANRNFDIGFRVVCAAAGGLP